MKKQLLAILIGLLFITACGNDSAEDLQPQQTVEVKDSIPTLEGEIIFLAGDAVLKGDNFVYGVNMDSLALDLADQVEVYKQDQFDMVPVKVKAKIINNPRNNGWDEIIELRKVLSISAPKNGVVKDTAQ